MRTLEKRLKWNLIAREKNVGIDSRITNCNAKNACGDLNFTAALCFKPRNDGPVNEAEHVMEAPIFSWNHIIKYGYWCMPCCILEDNIHPRMKVCSKMAREQDIVNQHYSHGRCGIEFDP